MKSCNTSVARSMGYMSHPSVEETNYGSPVTIMGPREGKMVSYHASGSSSKDEFLASRRAFKKAMGMSPKEYFA